MNPILKAVTLILCILLLPILLASCLQGTKLLSIGITPLTPSIYMGKTQQFGAMGVYSDMSTADITTTVTWTSSSTSVATINSAGLATALTPGTTTITATSTAASGSITNSITLTVTGPTSIAIGGSIAQHGFTATGTFPDGTTMDITTLATWSSSDTTVITVSNVSGSNGTVTSLNGIGRATITAAFNGISGTLNIWVSSIVSGLESTIAIKADGTVWAWGANTYGQLGDGTITFRYTPVQINITGVKAIAGGDYFTLALKSDGTVWAWGRNNYGQLGIGSSDGNNHPTPVQASALSGTYTAIAAGTGFAIALKSDGTVWAWGYNGGGQLGNGTTCACPNVTPTQVSSLSGITKIKAGGAFAGAKKSDSTYWAWGGNAFGQLGDGTTANRTTPVQISNLTGVTLMDDGAALGTNFTIIVKSDGTVWTWGDNDYGELGNSTNSGTTNPNTTSTQVSGLSGIFAVGAGVLNSIALKTDGTVWTWGGNGFGQIGIGTLDSNAHYTPVQVSGLTGIIAVTAGGYNYVAVKSDGTIWEWGDNVDGQLGDGTQINRSTPVQVSGLTLN